MHLQDKLEKLLDEYLNEIDKKNIQQISIKVPKYKGLFFISDAAKFDITKPQNGFRLGIYFSFNGQTREGKRCRDRIANYPALSVFEKRYDGRNTTGYYLETNNDKTAIAKMVELIIQALLPDTDLATVDFVMKRVTWHTLKD